MKTESTAAEGLASSMPPRVPGSPGSSVLMVNESKRVRTEMWMILAQLCIHPLATASHVVNSMSVGSVKPGRQGNTDHYG